MFIILNLFVEIIYWDKVALVFLQRCVVLPVELGNRVAIRSCALMTKNRQDYAQFMQ